MTAVRARPILIRILCCISCVLAPLRLKEFYVSTAETDRDYRHQDRGAAATDEAMRALSQRLKEEVLASFAGALTIRHVDAGSCNGCELEIHACNNAYYNLEGLGIRFVASPRHADMLLVTGPVSRHMETALKRTYEATPDPKLVVADRRLRLHRRHFRRELRQLRPGIERDSGRRHGARLPAHADAIMQGILTAIVQGKLRE